MTDIYWNEMLYIVQKIWLENMQINEIVLQSLSYLAWLKFNQKQVSGGRTNAAGMGSWG